jgi:hypothetical protein
MISERATNSAWRVPYGFYVLVIVATVVCQDPTVSSRIANLSEPAEGVNSSHVTPPGTAQLQRKSRKVESFFDQKTRPQIHHPPSAL